MPLLPVTGQTGTSSVRLYNTVKECVLSFSGSTGHRLYRSVHQFGLWNNQPARLIEGNETPIRYPAVFVEFENSFVDLSMGRQQANSIMILHLVLEHLKMPDIQMLTFKDELYAHLRYEFPKAGFQSPWRNFETPDSSHANVIDFQQEWTFSWIDDDAADEKKYKKKHPFDVMYDIGYTRNI